MEQMSYSLRCTVIVDLIKKLRKRGSWCGETHIQKAMYIVQDLAKANLGYKFIMYKHGPFSFELKDELAGMRASNVIELSFPQQEYGPSICATEFGERIYKVNEENIEKFKTINDFVANWFAASDVKDLEKVATAYYVSKKYPRDPITERAKIISGLKPHVDIFAAEEAVKIVDKKREEAKRQIVAAA